MARLLLPLPLLLCPPRLLRSLLSRLVDLDLLLPALLAAEGHVTSVHEDVSVSSEGSPAAEADVEVVVVAEEVVGVVARVAEEAAAGPPRRRRGLHGGGGVAGEAGLDVVVDGGGVVARHFLAWFASAFGK